MSEAAIVEREVLYAYLHVIPGTARYLCRVIGCTAHTWANVPYGYCPLHLRRRLSGIVDEEQAAWPACADSRGHRQACDE
mgnify:CR=1 FL=1